MKGGWQSPEKIDIKNRLGIIPGKPDDYRPKPDDMDKEKLRWYYEKLLTIYKDYWFERDPNYREALKQEFTVPKLWFSSKRGHGREKVYETLFKDLFECDQLQIRLKRELRLNDILADPIFGFDLSMGSSTVAAPAAAAASAPAASASASGGPLSRPPGRSLPPAPHTPRPLPLVPAGVGAAPAPADVRPPIPKEPYPYSPPRADDAAADDAAADDAAASAAGVGAVSNRSHIPPKIIFKGPFSTGVATTLGAKALRRIGHILDDEKTDKHLAEALASQQLKCPGGTDGIPTFFESGFDHGPNSKCKNCFEKRSSHMSVHGGGGTKSSRRHRSHRSHRRGANKKSRKVHRVRKSRRRRHRVGRR
jgi:hypothetical protein